MYRDYDEEERDDELYHHGRIGQVLNEGSKLIRKRK